MDRIQGTHPELELWWDSPLTEYELWRRDYLGAAPGASERADRRNALDRFFDPKTGNGLLRGVTTNPSLVANSVLAHPAHWRDRICRFVHETGATDPEEVLRLVQRAVVAETAEILHPLWRRSGGKYGWVSAQTDPRHTLDADAMIEHARYLADISPNVMVKIPGSKAGYEAMSHLVAQGISINNTLAYTVPQFTRLAEIVRRTRGGGADDQPWRAVITHMIGRYGAPGALGEQAKRRGLPLDLADIRWAEVAIVKNIQNTIRPLGPEMKMLLSSLQVDIDPETGRALCPHITETCGCGIVYTLKPDVLKSLVNTEYQRMDFPENAMSEPIPTDVFNRLMKLPYFRTAVDPDGLDEKEFETHPSFVDTYAEILQNHSRLKDFVEHIVENSHCGAI